jgi:hypothetical protein
VRHTQRGYLAVQQGKTGVTIQHNRSVQQTYAELPCRTRSDAACSSAESRLHARQKGASQWDGSWDCVPATHSMVRLHQCSLATAATHQHVQQCCWWCCCHWPLLLPLLPAAARETSTAAQLGPSRQAMRHHLLVQRCSACRHYTTTEHAMSADMQLCSMHSSRACDLLPWGTAFKSAGA